MTSIYKLPKDILSLFLEPRELSEDFLEEFGIRMKELLRDAFTRRKPSANKSPLVASSFGLPSRQLWYKVRAEREGRPDGPTSSIRFIIGHFVEELVLLLAKEAGHDVIEEQLRVAIHGVRGKQDARFDGVITDVKTASSFAFKKFQDGSFLWDDPETDPYGYKYQLAFYLEAQGEDKGCFLVINKESGEMVLVEFSKEDLPDVLEKIDREKINLEQDEPPKEKCYPDEPYGKSGNRIIARNCSYCDFKFECWKDANGGKGLIEHKYKTMTAYFSELKRPPRKSQKDEMDDEKPETLA